MKLVIRKATQGGGPYIGPRGGKWADPKHTIPWEEAAASNVRIVVHKAPEPGIREVEEWEGEEGNDSHLTRKEKGHLDPRQLASIPGKKGEQSYLKHHRGELFPGGVAEGQEWWGKYPIAKWRAFVEDVSRRGVVDPVLIISDPDVGPRVYEGNHRISAAVAAGLKSIPVEVRYFGHAEKQGLVGGSSRVQKSLCLVIKGRIPHNPAQLGFGGSWTRPPGAGWQVIPAGKSGGYRRRKAKGWEYWYPDRGIQHAPKPGDVVEEKPKIVVREAAKEVAKEDDRRVAAVVDAMAAKRTKGQRKRANEEAKEIVARAISLGRGLTDAEAVKVAAYTGKGGISGDLNQFYTRTDIAEAMWGLMGAYQDHIEEVLEPSCGSGVFLGTAPKGTKVTGVELDSAAAAVAEALHGHKHTVESKSFEEYTIENTGKGAQFDAVIANPPYCVRTGDIPPHKPEFRNADQYFIDTSIDHIKDGGTAVLLIHGGILNNHSPRSVAFRERLLARCEVLDAFRLPNTIFEHTHCGIGADILVLRKRDSLVGDSLLKTGGDLQATLTALGAWDQTFIDGDHFEVHTDHVLGTALSKEETGWRATVEGDAAAVPGLLSKLTEAKFAAKDKPAISTPVSVDNLTKLAADIPLVAKAIGAAQSSIEKLAQPPVLGNVSIMAGQRYLYVGEPPKWVKMESVDDVSQIIKKSGDEAISKAHDISIEIADLIKARDEGDYYKARFMRRNTASRVQEWVKENGIPGSHRALAELSKSAPQLLDFLACVDSNGELSDVLAKDAAVTLKPAAVDKTDLLSVANYLARISDGYVSIRDVEHNWEGWEGSDDASVRARLLDSGQFAIEQNGELRHLEDYLTGNLYDKLDAESARLPSLSGAEREHVERQIGQITARIASKKRNIDDIPIQLRVMNWMPLDWFSEWINSPEGRLTVFGRHEPSEHYERLVYSDGIYELQTVDKDGVVLNATYDSKSWLKYLNRLSLGKETRALSKDIEEEIEKGFEEWLKTGPRRDELENLYNRTFNAEFRKEYSGETLGIEGMSDGIIPHAFQNQAVRWAAETGRGILGQDVGLGKTFIAILLARLRKQQGTAKRPMVVVPKSVATNWAEEVETLFPGSKVLVIGEHRTRNKRAAKKAEKAGKALGLEGDALDEYVEDRSWKTDRDTDIQRNQKLAMVKQNEYDLIICTSPAFHEIPMNSKNIDKYEKDDFWYQRASRIGEATEKTKSTEAADKRIEKMKANWATDKLQRKFKHAEALVQWEDLGIDCLMADEAHAYKNLYAARSRYGKNPKFLGGSGQSIRARKMQHMSKWVRDANPTNGVYFLTATPTKNSPLEVFNMLQHIAPESFNRIGIDNSEQFIDRFCQISERDILTPPGRGSEGKKKKKDDDDDDAPLYKDDYEGSGNMEPAACVTGFTNLKELEGIMDGYMLIQTATDVGLKIPEANHSTHLVDMTEDQKAVYDDLRNRAAKVNTREDPGEMFRVLDLMKKAAQDLQLYDPEEYKDWYRNSPKYKACVESAYQGAVERGGQIVFCDHNAAHDRIKQMLVEKGLKPEQVGIINAQVAKDSAARQEIGNAFNRGEIKVVIGNTGTMGEGVNLQGKKHEKGTTDIHHLDQPWDPGTMHQRNGRGVRQGNRSEQVDVHTYLSKGSFDGFRYSTLMGKERWLDKLRSGADSIANEMEGQNIDESTMLAMLSEDPDAAMEMIQRRRANAESAWFIKQSQLSIDSFYAWQKKAARLPRLEGEAKLSLQMAVDRGKRILLRNEVLPQEIREYLESGATDTVAVGARIVGQGDSTRMSATLLRPDLVLEPVEGYVSPEDEDTRKFNEAIKELSWHDKDIRKKEREKSQRKKPPKKSLSDKVVVQSVNLKNRKITVRHFGESRGYDIEIDLLRPESYAPSADTHLDELKQSIKGRADSWEPPLPKLLHHGLDFLEQNRDMVDAEVRDWYSQQHGQSFSLMVRRDGQVVRTEGRKMQDGDQVLYPWGKDRQDLVAFLATTDDVPTWTIEGQYGTRYGGASDEARAILREAKKLRNEKKREAA